MAYGVTVTIVSNADGTCAVDPTPPVHVPLGATVTFKNLTEKTVTIGFDPPLSPDPITLEAGAESSPLSPEADTYDMAISCYPPDKAGPKLIIDEPPS